MTSSWTASSEQASHRPRPLKLMAPEKFDVELGAKYAQRHPIQTACTPKRNALPLRDSQSSECMGVLVLPILVISEPLSHAKHSQTRFSENGGNIVSQGGMRTKRRVLFPLPYGVGSKCVTECISGHGAAGHNRHASTAARPSGDKQDHYC